jgi:thiol-disulfide isomerase/thioredoxin
MMIKMISTLWLCLIFTAAQAVEEGDTAPAWKGIDLVDGSQIVFPDILNNKPAVLVFWATWCPYCKAFMPYMKEIQADYAKNGVQIISFNALERGVGNPKDYVDTLRFPLVAIADADNIAEQYNVQFIPGLMIVNGDGMIVYRRKNTNLPAGKTVSQQWSEEVRQVLDILVEQ